MRRHGVRLANAHENMGQPRYAFNKIQRKCLPECYRPPADTLVAMHERVVGPLALLARGRKPSIT
jgi:hypothetical protein